MLGQLRQQHRANSDADDTERQLIQPVGIVEVRNRAVGAGGDNGADEQVDLGNTAGEDSRNREHPEPAHLRIDTRQLEPGEKPGAPHRPPDQRQLRDAGDYRRPSDPHRRIDRILHRKGHQRDQHRDVDDVEDHRREGGGEIAAERIEDSRIGGHQRHAGEIREQDACEQDREVEFFLIIEEAGHERHQHPRHEDFGEDGDADQQRHQPGHDAGCEVPRLVRPIAFERG
jgi:hypothetical protein